MHIYLHLPRPAEAQVSLPQDDQGAVVVAPKFYKKTGWIPVQYITTLSKKTEQVRYVLTMNAGTGALKLEKLVEVVPACDDPTAQAEDEQQGPQA